jgi:DNA-binding response OmpR family regulator
MNRILLVEDDVNIRDMICRYFYQRSGDSIIIDTAENGAKAIDKAYSGSYDLLLLDIMLPEADGFEVCREVRRYSDVPIMFITARTSQEDMFTGFALGCDDYIVKPFPLPLLYEKSKALIKRSKGLIRSDVLKAGEITLNPNNGIVTVNNDEIYLKAKEYGILRVLLENKDFIVSRETLLNKVWGYDSLADERVLDTHIKNLRKALKDSSKQLKTIRKRGYKIEDIK